MLGEKLGKITKNWRTLVEICFLIFPSVIGLLYSKFILNEALLARLVPFILIGFLSAGHSYLAFLYLWPSGQQGHTHSPSIIPLCQLTKMLPAVLLFFIFTLLIDRETAWGLVFYLLSIHYIWQFYKIGRLLQSPTLINRSFALLLVVCFLAYHCMPFNELETEEAVSFALLFPYSQWISQGTIVLLCAFFLWCAAAWKNQQLSSRAFCYYTATLVTTAITVFNDHPWALPFFAIIFAHTASYFYFQFFALQHYLSFLRQSPWRTLIFLFFFCGIAGGVDYWLTEINLDISLEAQELFARGWEILVKALYLTVAVTHFYLDYYLWKAGKFKTSQDQISI